MNDEIKIIRFEEQINNISKNIEKMVECTDKNTISINEYGKNLTQLFVVQKTLCKEIGKSETAIQKNTVSVAVLNEKFLQFKRLGISASVFVGCIGAFKILYSIFP